jgi:flagellar basal-body rod protein FlgC
MSYISAFEISSSGMAFERLRADVAAANLANMHTTRSLDGGPYKPVRAVAGSTAYAGSFEDQLSLAALGNSLRAAQVQEVVSQPRMVHEPSHPDANDKGFVAYPNVDVVTEMVSLMTATRSYEANVSALNAAKAMALKTLEIGGR